MKALKLIQLYCTVCHYYNTTLVAEMQRLSNNFRPKFTNEECMTAYIFGIAEGKFNAACRGESTACRDCESRKRLVQQRILCIKKDVLLQNSMVKKKKGQACLDSADSLFSALVSRARQAIESFFNWIQEKTHIQNASKVRSDNGLLSFIFARISMLAFFY